MRGIIQVERLSFRYSRGEPVLANVSFTIAKGSFTAIVGPNGAGKSTLLSLLCGSLRVQEGAVRIDGRSVEGYTAPGLSRKVAVVRQETGGVFGFSVAQTVMMARTTHFGVLGFESAADREAVGRALAATDTQALADRPLSSLSGGERQRVYIARALAQETPILLLDEPTSSLDLRHQVGVFDLLKAGQIDSGLTVVTVMHDLNLAGRYCDEVLMLGRGNGYEHGPTQRVLTADRVGRFFGVEVASGQAGGWTVFVPIGRLGR